MFYIKICPVCNSSGKVNVFPCGFIPCTACNGTGYLGLSTGNSTESKLHTSTVAKDNPPQISIDSLIEAMTKLKETIKETEAKEKYFAIKMSSLKLMHPEEYEKLPEEIKLEAERILNKLLKENIINERFVPII